MTFRGELQGVNLLDLFSGIGGFSLGLEQAGFRTVAFCEIEPYPQAVLKKHWPGVPVYDDIRNLTAARLAADGVPKIDAICGGFPCQDLSYAGRRAGLEGARSGLWSEYARLIGEIKPRWAIMENVPGLLTAGMGAVLRDLAALGYDAWWDCLPALAVGAPHRRDRVWIIAHADGELVGRGRSYAEISFGAQGSDDLVQIREAVADADNARSQGRTQAGDFGGERTRGNQHAQRCRDSAGSARGAQPGLGGVADGLLPWVDASAWLQEPEGIPRVTTEKENRAARLRALGNAVVPQIPAMLGLAIMEAACA